MSAVVIGGVVVVIVVLLLIMMMRGGDSTEESVAPAPTQGAQEYKADEVPQPPVADDAPSLEEEEPVVEQEVPENAPAVEDPTKIDGCVGWFTGESFDEDEQVWKDKSGKGNNCTEIRGAIFKTEDSQGRAYIQGSKEDGLRFPKACMTNNKKHTFFSVARYARGADSTNQRIFDGVDSNYLVGFHGYGPCEGIFGSAHREGNGWIGHWECAVHNKDNDGNFNWILHTDQKSVIRVNGARKTSLTTLGERRTSQMTINDGQARPWGQTSEWQVGECIFYDRELNEDEIEKVELMLHKKWRIPRRIRQQQWMHHNPWSRYWNDGTGGFTNQEAFKSLNRFGNHCGDKGMQYYAGRFIQHHYYDNTSNTWKPNGNWGFDGGCLSNAATGAGAKKSTQWTSTDDSRSWQDRLSKAMNIDCGKNGLQNFEFELTPDGSQVRVNYQCSADKLNALACSKKFQVANQDGIEAIDFPSSTHAVGVDCGLGATNKLQWTKDASGRWGYEVTCCPLEDV